MIHIEQLRGIDIGVSDIDSTYIKDKTSIEPTINYNSQGEIESYTISHYTIEVVSNINTYLEMMFDNNLKVLRQITGLPRDCFNKVNIIEFMKNRILQIERLRDGYLVIR